MLYWDERRQWLVKATAAREFHTHKGIVKLADVIGRKYGEGVKSSLGLEFWILRPTTYDHVMSVFRHTQIMYPKDIGLVLLRLGISPGSVVLEAGTGSGAMTLAAANAVRPDGHVYSYEIREEFLEKAERNLSRAGVLGNVTVKNKDAQLGFDERDVDAVVIDLGEPWALIPHAYEALKGGASLVSFSPTMNQVEKTVTTLRKGKFRNIESLECFLRHIRAEEGKSRPVTMMIAHTGYLTFATKIL